MQILYMYIRFINKWALHNLIGNSLILYYSPTAQFIGNKHIMEVALCRYCTFCNNILIFVCTIVNFIMDHRHNKYILMTTILVYYSKFQCEAACWPPLYIYQLVSDPPWSLDWVACHSLPAMKNLSANLSSYLSKYDRKFSFSHWKQICTCTCTCTCIYITFIHINYNDIHNLEPEVWGFSVWILKWFMLVFCSSKTADIY